VLVMHLPLWEKRLRPLCHGKPRLALESHTALFIAFFASVQKVT